MSGHALSVLSWGSLPKIKGPYSFVVDPRLKEQSPFVGSFTKAAHMSATNVFEIQEKVWFNQKGRWHFVKLSKDLSQDIKFLAYEAKHAWGSVRVCACLKGVSWVTSLFPDKRQGIYLLPIKHKVCLQANIAPGDLLQVRLEFGV